MGDLEYLSVHLRDTDKEEVLAFNSSVLTALQESEDVSYHVKIIDFSGKPAGILGLSRATDAADGVWLLGTPELQKNSRVFLRYSKDMIRELFKISDKDTFFNYSYSKNTVHHRWLKWCGATFDPNTVDVKGHKFFPFYIERDKHV